MWEIGLNMPLEAVLAAMRARSSAIISADDLGADIRSVVSQCSASPSVEIILASAPLSLGRLPAKPSGRYLSVTATPAHFCSVSQWYSILRANYFALP